MTSEQKRLFHLLRNSRYFQTLADKQLERFVALTDYYCYEPKMVLLNQGEANEHVYIIANGSASITFDGKLIYQLFRTGDLLGEISVMTGRPSLACIEANERLELAAIHREEWKRIYANPKHELNSTLLQWFSTVLSDKLIRTSQKAKLYEEVIEEIRQQKSELEAANLQLTELNQRLNQFVGMVTHDLRSPLSTVLVSLNFLLENPDFDQREELLGRMKSSTERGLDMVRDILDLASITSGKIRLNPTCFSLALLLEEVVEEHRFLWEKKGVEVRIESTSEEFHVWADRSRLQQVLANLISNAIKFTPSAKKVRILAEPSGGDIQIVVEDQGLGIPAARFPKLFDKHERTTTRGTDGEKGTGFGLPLAKELLQAHQRDLTLESEVGKGSRFGFSLPGCTPGSHTPQFGKTA